MGSFEFSISFILAMVVMYDAIGVRQETGKQARVLNRLLFDDFLKLDGVVLQEKLKEYVGHTPIQVAAGDFRHFDCIYSRSDVHITNIGSFHFG